MADDRRSSGARTDVAAPTRGGDAPTGARQIAPAPPPDGGALGARTIGSYEIEGLLGEGGIGRVYAAHDRVLGRRVAIKTLRPELSRDRSFVERFYGEAKNLGHLNHPNITTVYAWHAEADDAFMVMELVLGYTLDAMLAREPRFSLRDSLAILVQAAAGIGHAHRMGIVHRDLKPANLMVTHEGAVKIMDFGIARVRGSEHLTRVGDFCGTFLYASPEQIRGEEVDERSDLYSLAIVFYRLLAGHPPFTSNNEYALMTAQLQQAPPPLLGQVPDLDAATEEVVMRALAKRPEDRFASVEEFARAAGAMALRGESADILQQLCARIFGEADAERTRIVTPLRPPTAEVAPPQMQAPASRVAEPAPPPKPAARERIAPSPAAIARAAPPPAIGHRRQATRLPWLIGGGVLALPLLVAAYYLAAGGGPTVSLPSGSGSPAAASSPSSAAPPERSPPEQEVQSLPTPAPFETTKAVSPPAPANKDSASQAADRTAADAAAAPPAGGDAANPATGGPAGGTQVAPAAPAIEPAKPATTAAAGTQVDPTPPGTEPAKPVTTAAAGTQVASTPPGNEAAKPATTAPAAGTQVASAPPDLATANPPAEPPAAFPPLATPAPQPPPEQQPAPAPEATAKPQTPEGQPDLQGRVTGVKGLNEIELDKSRWIRIYGIVDRARGAQASQHVEALKRYLKPSQNHLVCYHKDADTYRCYSDGQDVARLALHDRLVQLAPNAPREYRELLSQRP